MGRPAEIVKRPAITIGVMPQYSVITGLGKVKQLQGEGLLDRFIYSLPEDLRGHRHRNQPPVPDRVIESFEEHIRALLDLQVSEYEDGSVTTIRMSKEVEETFRSFEDNVVESGMLNPEIYGKIPGWASKFGGKVARIAALLHCAELLDETKRPWEVPISKRTIKKAIAIGEHIADHARAAFDLLVADKPIEDAIHTLNWIRGYVAEGHPPVVYRRNLWRPFRGKYRKPEDFDPVIDQLIAPRLPAASLSGFDQAIESLGRLEQAAARVDAKLAELEKRLLDVANSARIAGNTQLGTIGQFGHALNARYDNDPGRLPPGVRQAHTDYLAARQQQDSEDQRQKQKDGDGLSSPALTNAAGPRVKCPWPCRAWLHWACA